MQRQQLGASPKLYQSLFTNIFIKLFSHLYCRVSHHILLIIRITVIYFFKVLENLIASILIKNELNRLDLALIFFIIDQNLCFLTILHNRKSVGLIFLLLLIDPFFNKCSSHILNIELYDILEESFDLSFDKTLKGRVLPDLLLIALHWIYAHSLDLSIASQDCLNQEFNHCHSAF